jgi:GNAT superfamily N-acetyltransferase
MIKVRNATVADTTSIVDFQIKMAMETENLQLDQAVVRQGVGTVFQDPSKGSYYVAEADGKVVASLLTTYEWSDWRNGNVIWIQSVFVNHEFRGRGIFRKLYDHIKSIVLDERNSYRGIRLYVDKSNLSAQRVYKKLHMENHHYETFEWMKS